MRRIVLPAILLAAVLIIQLTFINGLRLPGGGVPDLVLVVVAAVGLAGGPVAGSIAGFAAGLCLDLAPPGSSILGLYALVFTLVGWACGRLRGTLARSAVLPIVIAASAAVVGEIMAAVLGMALRPDQVTWTSVRQILPANLFYDVAISPFVLYLVLLVTARLGVDSTAATTAGQDRLRRARAQAGSALGGNAVTGRQGLAGSAGSAGSVAGNAVLLGLGGWLAGPPQSRRGRKAAARRALRVSTRRAGDGWVGDSAAARRLAGSRALSDQALSSRAISGLLGGGPPGGAARLRQGVAGSAAGGVPQPRGLPSRPVNLRLASGRAGRPVVTARGVNRSVLARLGRRRSRRDGGFRPSAMPGGSATRTQVRRVPLGMGAGAPARMHFGSRRSGAALLAGRSLRARQRGDGVVGGGALTRVGSTGRRTAAPRFRIKSGGLAAGTAAALTAGRGPGSPSLDSFRRPAPRLRMRARRGDGMLGGLLATGPRRTQARRPATPRFRSRSLAGSRPMNGKRPKFRHRRWPVLSPLAARIRAARGPGSRVSGRRGSPR